MRILTTLLLLIVILVSHCARAEADDLILQPRILVNAPQVAFHPDVQQWLTENRTISVGVWGPSHPPIGEGMSRGVYQGIAADYLDMLQNALHVKFELHYFNESSEALAALQQHQIMMLAMWNPGRWPTSAARATTPWLLDKSVLLKKRGDNLSSKNFTLGVVPDDMSPEQLHSDYPTSRLQFYSEFDQAVTAVNLGQVDALWLNRASASYLLNYHHLEELIWVDNNASNLNLSFGVDEKLPLLVDAIDMVLQQLPVSSRLRIATGWELDHDAVMMQNPLGLSTQDSAWLKRNTLIRVILPAQSPPTSFINSAGTPSGLIVDLLNRLNQLYGLKFSFEMYQTAQQRDALLQRYPDALLGSQWILPNEASALATEQFSQPVLNSPMVIMMRQGVAMPEDFNQLKGEKVALTRDNPLLPWLETWYPTVQMVITEDLPQALTLMDNKQVRAVIAPRFIARFLLSETQVQVGSPVPIGSASLVFKARHAHSSAIQILDKALLTITPQQMIALSMPWHEHLHASLGLSQENLTWAIAVAMFSLLVLLGCAVWIKRLRRSLHNGQVAQLTLSEQLSFIRTLIDNAPVALFALDNQGKILQYNQQWAQWVAQPGSSLANKTLAELDTVSSSARALLENQYQQMLTQQQPQRWSAPVSFDHKIYHLTGWMVPWRNTQGALMGVIGGWLDITERETLFNRLSDAKRALEQAQQSKTEFMRSMGHEMRTPLNAIIGLLEMELQTAGEDPANENMHLIWESACNLLSLTNDVFDVFRADDLTLRGSMRSVNLPQLIHSTLALHQHQAQLQGMSIEVETALKTTQFELDSLFIIRVFSSLLRNAIKHSSGNVINVGVFQGRDDEQNSRATLVLEVTNQGEMLSDVSANSEASSDTGLSLAACQQLAEQHHATLTLESDEDETVISFHFTALPAKTALLVTAPHHPASLQILLVDDFEPGRRALKQQLVHWGCQVEEAENGEQALACCQQRSQPFDLIITDCTMPVMDGFAFTRALRQWEEASEKEAVPVLGLTALTDFESAAACLAAGMSECLTKPLSSPALHAVLQRYFPALQQVTADDEDNERYRQRVLIQEMVAMHDQEIVAIRQACSEKNHDSLGRLAHRLRGGASLIHDQTFVLHCEELESACQSHDEWQRINVLVNDLVNYIVIFNRRHTAITDKS